MCMGCVCGAADAEMAQHSTWVPTPADLGLWPWPGTALSMRRARCGLGFPVCPRPALGLWGSHACSVLQMVLGPHSSPLPNRMAPLQHEHSRLSSSTQRSEPAAGPLAEQRVPISGAQQMSRTSSSSISAPWQRDAAHIPGLAMKSPSKRQAVLLPPDVCCGLPGKELGKQTLLMEVGKDHGDHPTQPSHFQFISLTTTTTT